ncbi:glycosyltransferase, partial [Vibrio casei]|uniref:glycosyltransferase n=2 Tax=Vibrionaceae TaxID=641 RepID=UPI003F99EF44
MKVCILAPIHIWSDIRVFKKQAITLYKMGFDVTQICKCEKEEIKYGIRLKSSLVCNKNKLTRMLLTPFLFIQCLKENADIYHCHNPDTLMTVFILRLLGKKVIYDTHEDFSLRILFKEWIPKPLRKVIALIISSTEKLASHCSNHTFVTQERMLKRLSKKTSLLGNLPILSEVELNTKSELNKEFRLVYLGLINESR